MLLSAVRAAEGRVPAVLGEGNDVAGHALEAEARELVRSHAEGRRGAAVAVPAPELSVERVQRLVQLAVQRLAMGARDDAQGARLARGGLGVCSRRGG